MKVSWIRLFSHRIFLSFLAFLLIATPIFHISTLPAFAKNQVLNNAQKAEFAQKNILFLKPSGSNNCYSGTINVYGDTMEEKIWVGLTSFMTDEQAAGVMGNMAHESLFNPAMHEQSLKNQYQPGFALDANEGVSYGLGLIQWSFGRRVRMYNYVKSQDASLTEYLDDYNTYAADYSYNGTKFLDLVGDNVANRLISIELEFLKDELSNSNSYKGIFNQNTVYDAAKFFLEHVEIPQNPTIEHHPERATDAEKYYQQFHNASISGGSSSISTAKADGSTVTILGDSLTVGATDNLLALFPQAVINAVGGMAWDWGIGQLSQTELRGNVVFAFGTNNINSYNDNPHGTLTYEQIQRAIEAIGSNRNIFFLTNYATYIDYSGNNELFRQAAEEYPNVYLIDWNSAASADPNKYMSSDGLHQSWNEGRELFAQLIYDGVTGAINNGVCSVYGELSNFVLAYAWPEHHNAPFVERMPAYAEVVAKRQSEGKYVGGSVYGVAGIDCGGWVTTLLQESGFDPEYNGYVSNTGPQEQWVNDKGWIRLNPSGNVDTSILQPGDVAFTDGHTWVYVGEIPGFETKIASASYDRDTTDGEDYGRAPMAGYESYEGARWYRKGTL